MDSVSLSLSLPSEKGTVIRSLCSKAIFKERVSLRPLSSLLGNFSWCTAEVPFAQSHYRCVKNFLIHALHKNRGNLDTLVSLPSDVKTDLLWWYFCDDPDVTILSDTSLTGWGCVCDGITAKNPWTGENRLKNINELELMAAWNALNCFLAASQDIVIRVYLDNQTSVS